MNEKLCEYCKHANIWGDEFICKIAKEENQNYIYAFNHPWSKIELLNCKDYDLDDFIKQQIEEYNNKS